MTGNFESRGNKAAANLHPTTMHKNQSPRVQGPVAPAPSKLTTTAGRPGFDDLPAEHTRPSHSLGRPGVG